MGAASFRQQSTAGVMPPPPPRAPQEGANKREASKSKGRESPFTVPLVRSFVLWLRHLFELRCGLATHGANGKSCTHPLVPSHSFDLLLD